jgi:hypothetical protein
LAEIEKARSVGALDDAHAELAILNAHKAHAASQPFSFADQRIVEPGNPRSGALLRGSAEAFSASFGSRQDTIVKKMSELTEIDERIATAVEKIESRRFKVAKL